jgi:hypothetical protein
MHVEFLESLKAKILFWSYRKVKLNTKEVVEKIDSWIECLESVMNMINEFGFSEKK